MEKRENIPLGALCLSLAALSYAIMGAFVKTLGSHLSDELLVFGRSFLCLMFLLPFLIIPQPLPLHTSSLRTHLFRGVAGFLNMYCFFYSIRYILLADAMLLNNTMPLFLPLVMWIWKRERISVRLIPGLLVGFLGVALILHPTKAILHLASLMALASGLFMSLSMAGVRELGRDEPLYRILFYYFLISSLLSAPLLVFGHNTFSALSMLLLLGMGIFAMLYQFLLTKGYQYASASKVSPLIYLAVVVSGLFDWLFWNKLPDWLSVAGTLLVLGGAILCITAEAKKR